MRLTAMTDYSLRLLMYVGQQEGRLCTIAEIAQVYGVSEAHLMKITHQLGLAGFSDQRSWTLEGSLAVFVQPDWVVGAEYRAKPDRLAFAREDDWRGAFVAWVPSKRFQMALAYVDLGSVGGLAGQRGYYLSVQGSGP